MAEHPHKILPGEQNRNSAHARANASEPPAMAHDDQIWNQRGTLTLEREDDAGDVILPPLPKDEQDSGPLRLILRRFLATPVDLRSRCTLRLDNGQSYNDSDIAELLARDDCPVAL